MIPKLVIFDCDGVLVDSEGPVNELLAEDLAARGLVLPVDEVIRLFVGGTMYGVAEQAATMGADIPPDWVDGFYQKMFRRLKAGVPAIPGVIGLLDRLDAAGIASAVASNGPYAKMRITLTPHGLWDRFGALLLSRDGHAPKPAPDMLLHAMKVTGAGVHETVMIDDSPSGCLAARNAGVRCLGYATEGQDERLAAVGAEVVHSMEEAARALGLAGL